MRKNKFDGNVKYYENGELTTKVTYKFVGWGIHAQPIYRKVVTIFSIANGVIKENESQSVKCFYR